MATLTLPVPRENTDESVRIAVMVVSDNDAELVKITGPVRNAVQSAFADPRLAGPLSALRMDAERMIARITTRWESPAHEHESRQLWEKTDGSTVVRWCVDRTGRHIPA